MSPLTTYQEPSRIFDFCVNDSYHVIIYQGRVAIVVGYRLGRKAALIFFWIAGYAIGIAAWVMKTPFLQFMENIGLSADTADALLAGLFGSVVMVLTVLLWSFLSSS